MTKNAHTHEKEEEEEEIEEEIEEKEEIEEEKEPYSSPKYLFIHRFFKFSNHSKLC